MFVFPINTYYRYCYYNPMCPDDDIDIQIFRNFRCR